MKVTTRKWMNAYRNPPLYDVLIDGKPIGNGRTSAGRVLKSPWGWLPILDGSNLLGSFRTRSECARYVASEARALESLAHE